MAPGTLTVVEQHDAVAARPDYRRRLLLIEDEPGIADFLTQGLRAKGYHVTHTADGSRGHRLAEDGTFSLVILDWMLPGTPGRLVLDALHDSSPELPIIVMSASHEARHHVAQIASRTIRFTAKPFAMRDMLTLIRDLLTNLAPCDELGGRLPVDEARRESQR